MLLLVRTSTIIGDPENLSYWSSARSVLSGAFRHFVVCVLLFRPMVTVKPVCPRRKPDSSVSSDMHGDRGMGRDRFLPALFVGVRGKNGME